MPPKGKGKGKAASGSSGNDETNKLREFVDFTAAVLAAVITKQHSKDTYGDKDGNSSSPKPG